ncbi:MAG: ABC transporter ATP-binding protein [Dehalococcoidia bacterium]|jgi:ABC-type branched-subunit amino acid transport system ATPase component|nr:ABC transporter ATP-binding protein [Dehalococcoidia bacterium]
MSARSELRSGRTVSRGGHGGFLEYVGVTLSYGGLVAVRNVSFTVERGEILCIIGPNGAGKTTLLRMTSGLLRPTAGEIWFEGMRTDTMPAHRIAALGSTQVFQDIQLFSNMSVLDNVMAGAHVWTDAGLVGTALRLRPAIDEERRIRRAAVDQLALLGLSGVLQEYPSELSWGEQKLVGLARALLCRPKLLLLDEPYGGLDTEDIERLSMTLRTLKSEGMTILMVEHLTDVVMDVADRVVVLHYGEKLAEGAPDTIRADERVIATYLGE